MPHLKNPELLRQADFVNGDWTTAASGDTLEVRNPATGKLLGTVPRLSRTEVDAAINAAEVAFHAWRREAVQERSRILLQWQALLLENKEDLARIITAEQGKPLAEAEGEVRYAASYFKWFAEEAPRNYGDLIPAPKQHQKILVQKQPIGVCASITPWNFPIAMLARKVAAALAAGCTLVAKPAEATPFSALAMVFLGARAGVPKGVFNVVTGDAEAIGQEFMENPRVKKVSFTGSTRVGRILQQQSAKNFTKLSLELGGNAPLLVFDDADLDLAVKGVMAAKFRNCGQTCIAINRLLVQRSIQDPLLEKLEKSMRDLKVGAGTEPGVDVGPLINRTAVNKFQNHFQDALTKGAKVRCGGGEARGNFVDPVLMSHGSPDMLFCQEETFGPLLIAMAFDTEEEAIRLANSTPYGLAAYFYARDVQRVLRVSDALEAGMVGVNETAISNAAAPFGGIKWSGYGREGSRYGMDEYMLMKYVLLG